MRTASLIANVVWVALGLGVCLVSLRLRLWDVSGPGSGFLPFLAGLVVGIVGLALLLREAAPGARRAPPFWSDRVGRNRVALVVVGLCAMAYLMPVLGFLLAAFVVMTFLLALTEGRRLYSAAALAVASSLCIYLLFASLLKVRLPRGLLGF
jgi:hypothetical protein